MKPSLVATCFLLALFALAAPSSAQATTILSSVSHNQQLGIVEGYTATQLSYPAAYYYDAVADAYLYDQTGLLRNHSYSAGGSYAVAFTSTTATPGATYHLFGDHYVDAYFYYCDYYCTERQYYDYCGFSQMAGGYYPEYYYFDCFYVCYFFYFRVYLGTTYDSVIVPEPCPDIEALELRAGSGNHNPGLINNTTQTALLGATVILVARAISDEGAELAGSYVWTASPNGQSLDPQGTPNFSKYIFWETEGMKQVRVTFTPPGRSCQVTATVNINVVLPRQFTLTAQQTSAFVKPGENCRDDAGRGLTGTAFALGCGTHTPGIEFTAYLQGPTSFISIPADSQIKIVQWANPYAFWQFDNEDWCVTRRSSEGNIESGWFLDFGDPYPGSNPRAYPFGENGAAGPIRAVDSPGYSPLDTTQYFRNYDLFETYLVYFTGDLFSPRMQRAVAVIPWYWGGEILFSSPGVWSSYYSFPPPQSWIGTATNTLRIFGPDVPTQPTIRRCSELSDPTPNPTPDPCYGSGWNCL